MNPNWLWLIIPGAFLLGMFIRGLGISSKLEDLQDENDLLREGLKNIEKSSKPKGAAK